MATTENISIKLKGKDINEVKNIEYNQPNFVERSDRLSMIIRKHFLFYNYVEHAIYFAIFHWSYKIFII